MFLLRISIVLLMFDKYSYQLWILQLINLGAEIYFLIGKVKRIFKKERERLMAELQKRFLEEFKDEIELETSEFRSRIFGEIQEDDSKEMQLKLLIDSLRLEGVGEGVESTEDIKAKIMQNQKPLKKGCLRAVWQLIYYFFYSMHYGAMEREFERFEKEERERNDLEKKIEEAL